MPSPQASRGPQHSAWKVLLTDSGTEEVGNIFETAYWGPGTSCGQIYAEQCANISYLKSQMDALPYISYCAIYIYISDMKGKREVSRVSATVFSKVDTVASNSLDGKVNFDNAPCLPSEGSENSAPRSVRVQCYQCSPCKSEERVKRLGQTDFGGLALWTGSYDEGFRLFI